MAKWYFYHFATFISEPTLCANCLCAIGCVLMLVQTALWTLDKKNLSAMMITKSEPTLCANCLSGIGFVLMHLEKMWTLDKNLSAMMITKSEPTCVQSAYVQLLVCSCTWTIILDICLVVLVCLCTWKKCGLWTKIMDITWKKCGLGKNVDFGQKMWTWKNFLTKKNLEKKT